LINGVMSARAYPMVIAKVKQAMAPIELSAKPLFSDWASSPLLGSEESYE
jgi:hypothetical protein